MTSDYIASSILKSKCGNSKGMQEKYLMFVFLTVHGPV